MTQEMKGLLLEDRWAPVTSTMGFLELGAEQAAQAFATWEREVMTPRGITVEVLPVSGTLEQALSSLLPLISGERRRRLFIPTRSAWTAYVADQWTGTDAASPMSAMAQRLGIRCLRVVAVPHTLRGNQGRYGAVMLDVYGPKQPGKLHNYVRALGASNDGGRWVFSNVGEPFPFEQVERYQARRVTDRFTFEMLKDYLRHLGLAPFDEDFYMPPGSCAWLLQKTGPFGTVMREYTLEEARAAHVL
ncbi:hypothetical protein [Hyalangium minutum]|uniref:Uncharacterized protein n=1 Tax=Hyalangium minutum TaxID=394096 RepID=A0A085WM25_9BACT|nr:hypothetical protein [Hyalangium minutum]KFE68738.1 hypothetical protein DB31_7975 [Hyalangium minutum]